MSDDGLHVARFNCIHWKGMNGEGVAYSAVRERQDPGRSREGSLKEYCTGEGFVRAHLSRKRETCEIDIAALKGKLADDTSKPALAFATNGIACCIGLGGGVGYFMGQGGRQANIHEGSELVLVFNPGRKILTHLSNDRQQYLTCDLIHYERSKQWSPKASPICGG